MATKGIVFSSERKYKRLAEIIDADAYEEHVILNTLARIKQPPFSATNVLELIESDTAEAFIFAGFARSISGEKIIYLKVIADDTTLTTGDGKMYVTIPSALNRMNLVDADASIYTASTSGTPTIQIYNVTDSQDMLSTRITIDINENTSYTATTPSVINATYDDVATGDQLRIDVDVAGTGTKGLDVILTFQLPYNRKMVYLEVVAESTSLTTGDGKLYYTVPATLNGMNLIDADALVYTVSTVDKPTIQIQNSTDSQDMLSTKITIDATERTSYTADVSSVVNGSYDDVVTGDQLRVDVDVAGTGTKGLDVILTFQLP